MSLIGKNISKFLDMYKYSYIILIYLLSPIFCQNTNGDTFFLDMGVVIKSEDEKFNLGESNSITPSKKTSNIIRDKEAGSIYLATTSEMISTIDKITVQVSDIEKEFESKLDELEIENSNLRNQIISLKKRLNSEILDTRSIEIGLTKPETESSIPSAIISKTTELIEEVEPQSESRTHKVVLKEFNNSIYTEGVIFYNNEQYDKCIEFLSTLPLDQKKIRNTSKALFFLADSYEKVGRYKQALICLESLSSFNDDNYSELILFKKGIIYRDIGMIDKAQRVFQTLVDFYPKGEYKIFAEQEMQNI